MFSSSTLRIIIYSSVLVVFILKGYNSQGIISRYFRTICYSTEQPNCNKSFIEVYKNLSRSVHNLTDADTFFWLFTNKNQEKPENLQKCAGKLPPNSNFDPENELIVIVTPYIAGFCDFAVYREWMLQIFQKGNYNVLVVDWGWGNKDPYHTAIENSKIAAKQAAIVLRNIQKETGIPTNKISLIGHSLAAHVAGWIGNDFPVGRITGLDPAGPGFHNNVSIDERLDPTDAEFVDVWHCNAGDCFPYFGINYDAGDVDFWINGGRKQISCTETILPSFLRGDFIYALENIQPNGCSHVHCSQYFKTSINPGNCQFLGVKCESYERHKAGKCHRCGENGENCLIMGFDTYKYRRNDTEYSERYYVDTSYRCPYCNNTRIDLQGYESTYNSSLQEK